MKWNGDTEVNVSICGEVGYPLKNQQKNGRDCINSAIVVQIIFLTVECRPALHLAIVDYHYAAIKKIAYFRKLLSIDL